MSLDEQQLPLENSGSAPTNEGAGRGTSSRRRLFMIPLAMVLVFSGAVIGLYFQPPGVRVFFGMTGLEPGGGTDSPIATAVDRVVTEEDLAALEAGAVVALGRLLPAGDIVTVATPYGAGDARVASLPVRIGQRVEAGTVLATLDNAAELKEATNAAAAEVSVAEALLAQLRQTLAVSQTEAEAALKRAETEAGVAKTEFERAKSMFDRGVSTEATLDRAKSATRQADQEIHRLAATVSRYRSGADLAQADILVAERRLDSTRVALTRARTNQERAIIRAPSGGTVLEIYARPGERPDGRGVLDFGNTAQMTAEVEVYQNQISRIARGNKVRLRAEAFTETLRGRVVSIGVKVGRQGLIGSDPAANTDARVITVTVLLDSSSTTIASRFVSLEVLAWFEQRAE